MPNPDESSSLRQRAEEIAREKEAQSPDNIETMSHEETRRILHDLRVDRIELEMQNEELRSGAISDITERKRLEDVIEKRLVALTRPLNRTKGITFEDLFDPLVIQRIQDEFSAATGVASIITQPDGTPITRPSNFCRLCEGIIRRTETGRINCCRSDALLGCHHPEGPIIQTCLSGGLWDAGASITVGDCHVANWLIGQVRDETQSEEKMRDYAHAIGAEEESVLEAFREVPTMSLARFKQVAQALFTLANQLSTTAYQNVQQARFIHERMQAEEALRRNEAKHSKMIANIGDVIVIIDQNGITKYKSPNITMYFGWRPDEVVGFCALENVHPEDLNLAKSFIGALMEKPNTTDTTEFRYRCKDGSYKWIEFTGVNLLNDPDIEGILGNYHDITERKQAEEDAKQEQTLNKTIIESIPGTFYMIDVNGRYARWNAYQRDVIVGKPESQIVATYALDTIHPDDRHFIGEKIASVLKNDKDEILEGRVLLRGGPGFQWMLMTGRQIIIRGNPYLIGIGIDITERKRSEAQIKKLSRAVEQSPVSIVITDLTGAIEYVNPKFTQLTGYTLEEVRGQNPRVLKGEKSSADKYRQLWECITQGREWRGEFYNRKKNGHFYWESASISPIVDNNGHITHFIAVKEDITQRKVLEEQFRQAQKLEAIGQLAGGVAHDFNNILAVMMIRLGFLQKNKSLDTESLDIVLELTMDAKRSASLTRQLLLFSRRSAMEVELLDLNELVTNLLKMLRRLIGEHITVRFDPCDILPSVEADAVMLEQVLMNLSVNAHDAMPQGGNLKIKIEPVQVNEERVHGNITVPPGQFVCVSVADTGCWHGRSHASRGSLSRSLPQRKLARAQGWGWQRSMVL